MDEHPVDEITGSVAEPVPGLRELLGAKLVAYLSQPTGAGAGAGAELAARLELAGQVAGLLAETGSPATVQAWFQGANPILGDRAPARVLVEDPVARSGGLVLAAARAFAT